jgi:hypothetical protein
MPSGRHWRLMTMLLLLMMMMMRRIQYSHHHCRRHTGRRCCPDRTRNRRARTRPRRRPLARAGRAAAQCRMTNRQTTTTTTTTQHACDNRTLPRTKQRGARSAIAVCPRATKAESGVMRPRPRPRTTKRSRLMKKTRMWMTRGTPFLLRCTRNGDDLAEEELGLQPSKTPRA